MIAAWPPRRSSCRCSSLIESRVKSPMLDLSIFKNRLFSAASLAAFTNGLARFALMFVFVFYFQGVQGDSPILAGIKLAPLALGMLISSPLAGIWADRRGSRGMAVLGMLVPGCRTRADDHARARHRVPGARHLTCSSSGVGSGMFNSPEHRGDDGHGRRRTAAGSPPARGCWCRTPARSSRSRSCSRSSPRSVPKNSAVRGVLRAGQPHHERAARCRSSSNMHTALWCLAGISVVGAVDRRRAPVARAGRGRLVENRRPRRRRPRARRSQHEHDRKRAAADRRGRRADRDDAAHDPLLRGDRPAAGRGRPRAGQAPLLHAGRRRADARDHPPARSARPVARAALRSCSRQRPRAPSCERESSTTEDPDKRQRILEAGARATSARSWSWCACAARSSSSSRKSWWTSAGESTSAWRSSLRSRAL